MFINMLVYGVMIVKFIILRIKNRTEWQVRHTWQT